MCLPGRGSWNRDLPREEYFAPLIDLDFRCLCVDRDAASGWVDSACVSTMPAWAAPYVNTFNLRDRFETMPCWFSATAAFETTIGEQRSIQEAVHRDRPNTSTSFVGRQTYAGSVASMRRRRPPSTSVVHSNWSLVAAGIYLAVTSFFLLRFLMGILLSQKLARKAQLIRGSWLAQQLASGHSSGRVRIAMSEWISVPITVGIFRRRFYFQLIGRDGTTRNSGRSWLMSDRT